MYSVILAGGSGSRLWPLSNEDTPKQFNSIFGKTSLLQDTVIRMLEVDSNPKNIFISTNNVYKDKVIEQLADYKVDNVIIEPKRRNTAPAIALVIKYLEEKAKAKPDSLVLVCPSDHYIHPVDRFVAYIHEAQKVANQGQIVLFGIQPDKPEIGYGYIKVDEGAELMSFSLPIQEFKEKPDFQTAKQYFDQGNYFWNAGMFLFRIDAMKEALKNCCNDIYQRMICPFDEMIQNFDQMPNISIDYAVMEKSSNTVVVPMNIRWSDMGTWDSIWEYLEKDEFNNVTNTNVVLENSHDNLVISKKKVILDGVDNILVVEGEHGLYIAERGKSHNIKNLLEQANKLTS